MDKEKEINDIENQNPYEGIDEKLVKFVKDIEFYDDYGKHPFLCTDNCRECNLQPLCEYRGEQNVNLALHLMDAGYGNVKQAVKAALESLKRSFGRRKFKREVRLIIEETIDEHIKLYGADE